MDTNEWNADAEAEDRIKPSVVSLDSEKRIGSASYTRVLPVVLRLSILCSVTRCDSPFSLGGSYISNFDRYLYYPL